MIVRGKAFWRHLSAAMVIALLALAIAGCGSAGSRAGTGSPSGSTAYGGHVGCSSAPRLSPIIFRPPGLSRAQKVPLVLVLHGADGTPQDMVVFTHFNNVAVEHGFVVAYLASCNLAHPWGPRKDVSYIGGMIDQLTASENIDSSRVYVTGFSAGGAEAWIDACQLSSKIAAVAIVSNTMARRTMNSCNLRRPISQLLIVGTADTMRWKGLPGVLPSAPQTVAWWRKADGCAHSPLQIRHVSSVIEKLWTSCTDGTAVGLYEMIGAGHSWPPNGPGAPRDYPTSDEVWSFLSTHTAAPLALSSADVQLVSLNVRRIATHWAVVAKFRLGEGLTLVAQVTSGPRPVTHRKFMLRRGTAVLATVNLPASAGAGNYFVRLAVKDRYKRSLTFTAPHLFVN